MEEKVKSRAIAIENKIRLLVCRLCGALYIVGFMKMNFVHFYPFGNLFHFLAASFLSILGWVAGTGLFQVIKECFSKKDWEWDETEYEPQIVLNNTVRCIGVLLLYGFLQAGVVIVFFPQFLEVKLFNAPVFAGFFLANSFIIWQIYRRYVFM